MAYQLKYYKDIASHGHWWHLAIHQDTDEVLTPMEIGPVLQSLRLVVQGDQADIDTPIVKTSLEMSFVDAPDFEEDRKCGYWEEFYTSSATEYKVILLKDGQTEWTGFITPDSFSEDLRYRGSVSIIARDNLGTLQDTTCDVHDIMNADGKVYIYQVISRAIRVSTCALNYQVIRNNLPIDISTFGFRYSTGNELMNQMVDGATLQEKTWQQALEDVLYSAGMVLRYVGGNRLCAMSMRDIPMCGHAEWWDVPVCDVRFIAHGRRELTPGVKEIVETVEYNQEEDKKTEAIYTYDFAISQYSNVGRFEWSGGQVASPMEVLTHGYTQPGQQEGVFAGASPLLDVAAYERVPGEDSEQYGAWDDKGIIYYLVSAAADELTVAFAEKVWSVKKKLNIALTLDHPVSLSPDFTKIMNTPAYHVTQYDMVPKLRYRLRHVSSRQATRYYNAVNKAWQSAAVDNTINIDLGLITTPDTAAPQEIKIEGISIPEEGTIYFEIVKIESYSNVIKMRIPCVGMYMRIRNIHIYTALPENDSTSSNESSTEQIIEKLTLTTKHSDRYAVRLTRDPQFAVCATPLPEVQNVTNAILAEGATRYGGSNQWVWHNKNVEQAEINENPAALSRLIHQQMLMYYAQPNNVLTGELVLDNGVPDFQSLWRWNNSDHILLSGTLNILTGRMEGATLRQFVRYDHMWETWVETEDVVMDYAPDVFTIVSHKTGGITANDIIDLPSWVTLESISPVVGNANTSSFRIMQNATGERRQAVFRIDTAWVRITQQAAGDYGTDYSSDYS